MPIKQIGNKVIIDETPLYYLFGPNANTTPGYFELEPKFPVNKKVWIARVNKHMIFFSDPLHTDEKDRPDEIVYQPGHRFVYYYQDGNVGVIPGYSRIEIAENHPNREEVILGLIRLAMIGKTIKRTPSLVTY